MWFELVQTKVVKDRLVLDLAGRLLSAVSCAPDRCSRNRASGASGRQFAINRLQ